VDGTAFRRTGRPSGTTPWPGTARGALCLSFDNLGEAAEIELGAIAPDAVASEHPSVTEALPTILAALAARGLAATFFVEGLNAEAYPEALRSIAGAGHEVAFHAWRHEEWAGLSPAEQAQSLSRGAAAFAELGLEIVGIRPPGGRLGGEGGLTVLRAAGLRYCSPAGAGAGAAEGLAVLPFEWRHVDASSVLPPLASVREQISGSPDSLDPGAFLAFLEVEIARLSSEGGFATFVLHPFMLAWLGTERLEALLDRAAAAARGEGLWVGRCDEAAEHVLAHADEFRGGAVLDATTWSDRDVPNS
jgi:peptidoglycan/xylan/chitin deacetylase (PgdA/CDA1 family)